MQSTLEYSEISIWFTRWRRKS